MGEFLFFLLSDGDSGEVTTTPKRLTTIVSRLLTCKPSWKSKQNTEKTRLFIADSFFRRYICSEFTEKSKDMVFSFPYYGFYFYFTCRQTG